LALSGSGRVLYLTRTLAKDTEIPHEELITDLGSVGYTRTEMVELPGQFAVRGGIIDVFSRKPLVLCVLSCSATALNRCANSTHARSGRLRL